METLDTALGYAERGWPVLAISPNSKVPIKDDLLQSNGALSASTDPEHIQKLFTQYPKANLAIATGQRSVVDVDLDAGMALFLTSRKMKLLADEYKAMAKPGPKE